MQFTTISFAIFFVVVFSVYWFVFEKSERSQNIFLLIASYVFYCLFDWRFSGLLCGISIVTWLIGVLIERNRNNDRLCRRLCTVNVVLCLATLVVFKYYNFFVEQVSSVFAWGVSERVFLRIALPLGISFYSFKAVSYCVDVYRNKIAACSSPIPVLLYISFFPQLPAGPIEPAYRFIPQICEKRHFYSARGAGGLRQILWGVFKKVVIADQCALYVDSVFQTYSSQCGSTLLIAAIVFSFQIYSDFSGYSDISIGIARLLGFDISANFKVPYFSRNIAEFWRRWHISLTSWFREYVYFPLGGSRCSTVRVIGNTTIVFLLSGLWHGANWTFLIWGVYYAVLFIPLIISGRNKKYKNTVADGRVLPSWGELISMSISFMFVTLGWVIFRADSIGQAFDYFNGMLQFGTLKAFYRFFITPELGAIPLFILCMLVVEWLGRNYDIQLDFLKGKNRYVVYSIYILLVLAIVWFWGNPNAFVYQQF